MEEFAQKMKTAAVIWRLINFSHHLIAPYKSLKTLSAASEGVGGFLFQNALKHWRFEVAKRV